MTHAGELVLDVQNLHVRFKNAHSQTVHAVNDVSFRVARGRTLGILGETGCGKSTLASALVGLIKPDAGSIVCRRANPAAYPAIQMVFQDPQSSFNPRQRVWQVISEPRRIHERLSGRELRESIVELALEVGVSSDHLDRYPHELSGGQRQRVAIARALAAQPEVLVLDEPTSALDVSVQARILNLLLDLQRTTGLAYVFISHDVGVVRHVCDEVAVMYRGSIVEYGAAADVFGDPSHAYTQTLLAAVPRLEPA
jgi:peptide/nickel transport system ATP-binding protein